MLSSVGHFNARKIALKQRKLTNDLTKSYDFVLVVSHKGAAILPLRYFIAVIEGYQSNLLHHPGDCFVARLAVGFLAMTELILGNRAERAAGYGIR